MKPIHVSALKRASRNDANSARADAPPRGVTVSDHRPARGPESGSASATSCQTPGRAAQRSRPFAVNRPFWTVRRTPTVNGSSPE